MRKIIMMMITLSFTNAFADDSDPFQASHRMFQIVQDFKDTTRETPTSSYNSTADYYSRQAEIYNAQKYATHENERIRQIFDIVSE
jgi:hypothetical protein